MVALVYLLLPSGVANATRPNISLHPDPCHGQSFTAPAFETFAQNTWRKSRWERQRPKALTIAAAHRRIKCARGGERQEMKRSWALYRRIFYKHRRHELWRSRVTPYCEGARCYALPVALVICESGGNYDFPYGAYSILDPAWRAWGGRTAHAGEATKREQDRVAHHGFSRYGEAPWECKGDGSTSWP